MSSVSVVTPSIPHRYLMLDECKRSVAEQTVKPAAHIITIDYARVGGAANLNTAIRAANTEWVLTLADDDLLYPTCIERLLANSDGADMVYPWCNVVGRAMHPNWNPNSYYDPSRLRQGNYIPGMVLIKKSVVEEVGYYPEVVCEDHAMWIKLLDAGKNIRCVPEILWEYRFQVTEDHKNISDGYDPGEV